MEDKRYFSKAWALLTRDKGWIKPLLVMTAATLVPVAGLLGVSGYGLEWARLTVWNIDSSPKQKNVQIGTCIASGWRGFVVSLGWSLCVCLCFGILSGVSSVVFWPLGGLLQALVSLLGTVISFVLAPILQIAEIRSAIYERISAGYRVKNVFEMIKRDKSGFGRLVLIYLCACLIMFVAVFIVGLLVAVPLAPVLYAALTRDEYLLVTALSQTIVWLVLIFILTGFVITFLYCGIYLITITTTALWMRQFDVASWGRSEDPLPSPSASDQRSYSPYEPDSGTDEVQGEDGQKEPSAVQWFYEPEQEQPAVEDAPAPVQPDEEPTAADMAPTEPQGEADGKLDEAPTMRLDVRDADASPQAEEDASLSDTASLVIPDKGVDELYADLYEVMAGRGQEEAPDEDGEL